MKIKHSLGAAALSHEGKTLVADEDGYIDVPYELAQLLLVQHEWTAEPLKEVGSTDPHSPLFVEAELPVVDKDEEPAPTPPPAPEEPEEEEVDPAALAKAKAAAVAKAKAAAKAKK